MRRLYVIAGIASVAGAFACNDPLSVDNSNSPDAVRALARPGDVEAIIGSSYNIAWQATLGGQNDNVNNQMAVMSFENSSSLANFNMGTRGSLPRNPLNNQKGNPALVGNFFDFRTSARAARSAADGLVALNKPGFSIGSPQRDIRARAFAYFVMGLSNGNMALVYDSGAVVTEFNADSVPLAAPYPPLLGHDSLMKLSLKQLDSSLKYAGQMTITLDKSWIPTDNGLTSAEFVRLIRFFKARLRAEVARTPAERAAVDWTAVRNDALGGLTADVSTNMNPSAGWDVVWYIQHFLFDTWTQQAPIMIGMADSSGGYDAWLATPLTQRSAFLIRSADQRFPPGDNRVAQQASSKTGTVQTPSRPNLYFRNRTATDPSGEPYANSFYDWYRYQAFFAANRIGKFTMFQRAESDLLAAEAYYRLGDLVNAIALINKTRVANGNLPPLPATMLVVDQVPGGRSCVPRVPDPATNYTSSVCGTLFEALKWEKRMELAFSQYGAWFFDSRGWGDLAQGTALEWPVPYQEMDTRNKPFYNQQGPGAPKGAYGY
jgi:hypothetical protein